MLEPLGLEMTTEAVYRAVLTCPEAGVAEIARQLVLPEKEVRTALDRLAELSLLRPSSQEVTGQPLSPGVGLTSLLELASRRLGVSLRTVRRMTAALLHRLDAQTRFQAAAVAARRGWL